MDLSFRALLPDYTERLKAAKPALRHGQENPATVARRLLGDKVRFIKAAEMTGVPALWLMPVFEREEPRFDRYFGNGDPLDRPTTDVPRGRGPFKTWEDGVEDALTLDHETVAFRSQDPGPTNRISWEFACWRWEAWNGFGPREYHGRPSGYLWSGTTEYAGGKYTGDGVWSRGSWDIQLGCVAIAIALSVLDPEIAAGFGPLPSDKQPEVIHTATASPLVEPKSTPAKA